MADEARGFEGELSHLLAEGLGGKYEGGVTWLHWGKGKIKIKIKL